MASLSNVVLTLIRDKVKKTVNVKVTGNVNFTPLEMCMMKQCKDSGLFKLRCKLWVEDSPLFTGADDLLFIFPNVFTYPDGSPTNPENFTFQTVVGESLLNEDWGQDEIYARAELTNNLSLTTVTKKSNVVKGWF
ncbi:MAG: hypothetical protein IPN79_12905 [Saprospiraceae bacterium]|nr:hypothetical protein [Saprospiraceae bacterium]